VLGKALLAGVRGISQGIVVYAIALMLGVDMNWNPLALVAVIVLVILGASLFSTFSLIVACLVRTRERFMGIGQLMTMPLFFASSAIYPTSIMPGWLKTLARINPLSYEVDALRTLMPAGGTSNFGLFADFAVIIVVLTGLVAVASHLYPRAAT
jgi:ABC-2 type transport system permease protein